MKTYNCNDQKGGVNDCIEYHCIDRVLTIKSNISGQYLKIVYCVKIKIDTTKCNFKVKR